MAENYRDPEAVQDEEVTGAEKEESVTDTPETGAEAAPEEETSGETTGEASAEETQAEPASSEEAEEAGETEEAGAEEESGADASKTSSEKKSGFFGWGKKADKEKAEMKEKIDGLEDKVRRQMAEFDNYRKRTEKEKDQMFSMGEKSVIEKMLPIVDNFERGFSVVEEEDRDDAFVAGMQKIYQQLLKQLSDLGVTPIEAVGKEFDPAYHNAVMQVESEELESGTVAQELQKGYMFHDQVLRHSMVSVVA